MEPVPETAEAVEEYGPFSHDGGDLLDRLLDQAERVRRVVPACVGVTLAWLDEGVAFTVVATSEEVAALDAVQYVAGGPCVDGARTAEVVEFTQTDPTAEAPWLLFARATAAASIASTLTLPILVGGTAVGSVNLYAATPDAFTGHHDEVAAVFSAWAPGAVTNADLDFSTREQARRAPQVLHDEVRLRMALGVLMTTEHLDLATAEHRLVDAARRAGATVATIAETLISAARDDRRPPGA